MQLTKSKYLIGLQCTKYLWTAVNHPELIPEPDETAKYRFDEGYRVEGLAKSLFKGISLPRDSLEKTLEALKKRKVLFEPSFKVGSLYARADILRPVKGQWDIIEVKQGGSVKEVYFHDVSFQRYVYEKAGLSIRKCFIMHVDTSYVMKGKLNPRKLLKLEDITKEVEIAQSGIEDRIGCMLDIVHLKESPSVKLSKGCTSPYECPVNECWDFLPEHHVFHLYRAGQKAFELYEKEIYAIADIPDDVKLTEHQEIQRQCAKTGETFVHAESLKHFLNTLHYPLCYLDFESFSSAIPFYSGTRPFQAIPFQFSLHVIKDNKSKAKHYSFIHSGKSDPRLKFLKSLKKVLSKEGTIIAYNQSFEKSVLNTLCVMYPKYRKWVGLVNDRIVDLIVPFRSFYYYSPKQKGSASLKNVLPAVTGKDYKDLDISNGNDASLAYLEMVRGKASKKDKDKIKKDLEKYCGLDTEGMVWIVDELRRIVNG